MPLDLPLSAVEELTLAERRVEDWRGGDELQRELWKHTRTHTHRDIQTHTHTFNGEAR